MTREEDGWLAETRIGDLKERVRIMNESKADLAVSIHQNSYHEESVFGAQVFYYTASGEGERRRKFCRMNFWKLIRKIKSVKKQIILIIY